MTIKEKAFSYIDEHKDELIAFWQELVSTESGSNNKAGVDAVADKVAAALKAGGATVRLERYEKAGNAVVAEFAGKGEPAVIYMGHMDTVFKDGTIAERPFTIKDGKAYGPGVLDMKGGVAIATYAASALHAAGFDERPIKVVFVGDEEIAHPNSTADQLILDQAQGALAAFNFETGYVDNSFVTGRKGMAQIKIAVKGVAAHAGNDPKRGRSAILEMAHKVIAIQALTDYDRGITFNVGLISGGTVPNAVPGSCEVTIDVRFLDPSDLTDIRAMIEKVVATTYIEGTTTELTLFKAGIIPMKTTPEIKKLFALLADTSVAEGFGPATDKLVGGGSDSAYTVKAGVPTICSCGVKGGFNHSPEEFAVVDSMFERAKLAIAMTLRLNEFK